MQNSTKRSYTRITFKPLKENTCSSTVRMANCYPASTLNMQIIIWPSTSAPVASRIREISKGTDSLSDNREPM